MVVGTKLIQVLLIDNRKQIYVMTVYLLCCPM